MNQTQQQIDNVFRLVDRPVWIVTAAASGDRGGLVATWVQQASIDPAAPLVVAALAPNHFTAELVSSSGGFALHLVGQRQIDLLWRFSIGSGRNKDKLAGLATTCSTMGSPILGDCLAWLDCRVVSRYDGGDRWYFWADVISGGSNSNEPPLTERAMFAAASAKQKAALLANLRADQACHASLRTEWRTRVSASGDNQQHC